MQASPTIPKKCSVVQVKGCEGKTEERGSSHHLSTSVRRWILVRMKKLVDVGMKISKGFSLRAILGLKVGWRYLSRSLRRV